VDEVRIGIVSLYLGYTTGVGKRIENIAKCLADNEHQVFLMHSRGPGLEYPHKRVVELKLPLSNLPMLPPVPYPDLLLFNTLQFRYISKYCERHDIEVLEFQQNQPTLATRLKIPKMVVVHGSILGVIEAEGNSIYTPLMRIRGKLEKKECELSDVVIAVSEFVKNEIIEYHNIKENKIKIVPDGGADVSRFKKNYEAIKPLKEKYNCENLLFSLGRLCEAKGYSYLFDALPKVLKEFPNTKLIVGGDGSLKNKLVKMAKANNFLENIAFLPKLTEEEVIDLNSACDVFVHPAIYDPMPLAVPEAMACEAPIVVAGGGGVPEEVGDAGIIVPTRDSDMLADSIIKFLKNEELRVKYGKKARKRVEKHFTWAKISKDYSKIIEGLL
jgi:glycosyltransferase involved in cell wall biosynthesis